MSAVVPVTADCEDITYSTEAMESEKRGKTINKMEKRFKKEK